MRYRSVAQAGGAAITQYRTPVITERPQGYIQPKYHQAQGPLAHLDLFSPAIVRWRSPWTLSKPRRTFVSSCFPSAWRSKTF